MFVLGISDSATFAMWAITLTVNGGMGIILYRVARCPTTSRFTSCSPRDELDQLEAFAREPGRTIDECHQWLQERVHDQPRGGRQLEAGLRRAGPAERFEPLGRAGAGDQGRR
jgi:hypothetical protein